MFYGEKNKMVHRLRAISGNNVTGIIHQGSGKHEVSDHIRPIVEVSKSILFIKLPRETVDACRRLCKRSYSFSYHEDITGRKVIIYATGKKGGFYAAYEGTVEHVSVNGPRNFVLQSVRKISLGEWYAVWAEKVKK